jgi:hypothetical protein
MDGHPFKPGEVFRVRARRREEKECGPHALVVMSCTLCKIFVHACRSMNEAQPKAIQELFKMIRKSYRKRRTP